MILSWRGLSVLVNRTLMIKLADILGDPEPAEPKCRTAERNSKPSPRPSAKMASQQTHRPSPTSFICETQHAVSKVSEFALSPNPFLHPYIRVNREPHWTVAAPYNSVHLCPRYANPIVPVSKPDIDAAPHRDEAFAPP